jgi:hypothetical protein
MEKCFYSASSQLNVGMCLLIMYGVGGSEHNYVDYLQEVLKSKACQKLMSLVKLLAHLFENRCKISLLNAVERSQLTGVKKKIIIRNFE